MDDTTEKQEQENETQPPTRSLFGTSIPLERETILFVIASALDVLMTWILIDKHRAAGFVESNPIARFFLDHWGPRGLVYFKFTMVAFVAVLCQIIALKREDIARRILYFATALVACVVIYSFTLLIRHSPALTEGLL